MQRILLLLLFVGTALGLGYWLGQRNEAAPPSAALVSSKQIYVCPMHPHITQGHPDVCPICGMDLVATQQAAANAEHKIHVDTATQAKLGVRLASAEDAPLSQDIATYATLVADESAVQRITGNVAGVLTKLHVSRVGQRIARGQVIYEISSQEISNIQYDYLDIQQRAGPARQMAEERRAQNRKAIEDARDQDAPTREQVLLTTRQSEGQLLSILQPLERDRNRANLRLKQIGFTDDMLSQLLQSGKVRNTFAARAQRTCVVKEIMARPGMQIEHMTEILHCVDPEKAWLELVLYPDQLAWVAEGDAITVTFEDGTTVNTRLTGLSPIADNMTRTVRARLAIDLQRAPTLGEYAAVTIHASPRQVLSVPKSAVMRSGRGNIVMRAEEQGHFMPVKVMTGIESAERVAILQGLEPGDKVVVNGQFLLDAAASIADAGQRLQALPRQNGKAPSSQDGK